MSKKVEGLQALRGIAFLLIFISHCSFLSNRTIYFGAFGVSLFIILSGFLDMVKYDEKQPARIRERLKRKIRKVYPLHLITMFAAVPYSVYEVIKGSESLKGLLLKIMVNLSLLQGFVPDKSFYFSLNAVSWFLTLVLTFVIVAPTFTKIIRAMLDRLCVKMSIHVGGGILCCIIIALQFIWVILWKNSDLLHWAAYINPLFRIFDYLLGMIAGYIYSAGKCKNDEKSKNQPGITLPISLVSISLAIVVTVF